MAASTVIKHLYDGTITASDGTGSPVTLVIPFSTGDLSVSALSQVQRATVAYEARGVLTSVRKAARTYPSGSFSFQVADYSDAVDGTAIDFFLKANSYSANVSTLGASADVYTVDLLLTVAGTVLGDAANHTVTLTDCDVTMDIAEGEPNTGTITFTCYGSVTIV